MAPRGEPYDDDDSDLDDWLDEDSELDDSELEDDDE